MDKTGNGSDSMETNIVYSYKEQEIVESYVRPHLEVTLDMKEEYDHCLNFYKRL